MDSTTAPTRAIWRLRPGIPVLRRDAETLQVGLTPPHAAQIPAVPEVQQLMRALRCDGFAPVVTPKAEVAAALEALEGAGLVVIHESIPPAQEAAHTVAEFGSDAPRRTALRARHRVGVLADPTLRSQVERLLEAAGLEVSARSNEATMWLVVSSGYLSRDRLDPLVNRGQPHLVVTNSHTGPRVGPFVEPGVSACLRCVDAHESQTDPRLPFLIEQAARADVTMPVDPVLEQWALSWAVRDLQRYAEGDRPSLWSTTVDLGPTTAPEILPRLRHPHCGCSWDALLDLP